jgi:CTD small phosphatase-like protein 2
LYKKKQNNTVTDKNEKEKEKEKDKDRDVLVRKNSFVIEKLKKNGGHDTNEKNEPNKNSRNVSVPHFIFKKRITKDGSEFKHKSKSKNNNTNINNDNTINKNYLNNQTNIKIIKNENEPRFDELVVIEFKLEKIIRGIDRNSSILNNLCFDFLNYFNESSISSMIEKLFDNKNLKIITISLKYLVFSIIFLYNNCSDSSFDENDKFLIQEIFSLNLQSILYLYEYIISKLKSKNKWANDIKNIIHNYKKLKKKIYSSNTNLYYQSVFDKIKNNSKYIRQITNRIFVSNKNTSDIILSFFKELEKKDFSEIKNFYITNIYKENSIYGYLYPFSLTDNNDNNNNDFIHEKLIYNNKKNTKKFTLFLGLEDILINYKLDNESELKGTLILRPGLIPFLREIHKFFEIIIFSLSKKQLADYLINSIDKKNQFFDYRLFRENFSIVNDEFIIDLSQINRPLSKILIISNIPQIYKLYKDNGIYLQSYWEENLKDKVLGQLMSILKNIANENGDIREILVNYRDNLVNQLILQ